MFPPSILVVLLLVTLPALTAVESPGPALATGGPTAGQATRPAFTVPAGPDEPLVGTLRVLDPQHPKADDAGPGDETRPWKSLTHAMKAAKAGETVCVLGGTYEGSVAPANAGTADQPIVFRSIPAHAATLTGCSMTVKKPYVRIEGFHFTDGGGITVDAEGVQVVGNRFTGVGRALSMGAKSTVKHVYIGYNQVADSQYGFQISGEGTLVEGNEVRRLVARGGGDCDYTRFFGKSILFRFNLFHGTKRSEIGKAHVDCFQTFNNNGEIAQDCVFEFNRLQDFHQGVMASAVKGGAPGGFVFRYNVANVNETEFGGKSAWGVNVVSIPNVVVDHNTFVGITWFGVGFQRGSKNGRATNNIVVDSATSCKVDAAATDCVLQHNLTFPQKAPEDATNMVADPQFLDAGKMDFRPAKDSPAIGKGTDGSTIGALPYPYVYYVDPRHPGATDDGVGYAGQPFKTLAKACAMARSGETILLRGGTYRETLQPQHDGVVIRVLEGERVVLSGADVVEGWRSEADAWVAPCAAKPSTLLRNGVVWKDFTYDAAGKQLKLPTGGDPRLHRFEAVLRERAIDLGGRAGIMISGALKTVDTVADPVIGGTGNRIDITPVKP